MTPSYVYAGTVLRVVDADTVDLRLDLGMRVTMFARVRVAGIDAPEKSTPQGQAAHDYARELLHEGDVVTVATSKPDKYGRTLARLGLAEGRDFARALVEAGHAVAYDGGARNPA